jgi:uncharacterized membrane protein YcaP (DUF421 family)
MDVTLWAHLFALPLPVLEKVLRPILVYGFLVVGLRLAGKRELAQLNPFDLIVLLMLSNTVQNAIIGDDNTLIGGLIGATTLLALNWAWCAISTGIPASGTCSRATRDVLIERGRIHSHRLRRELITLPELRAAAHKQGIASLDLVERAVLEPGGTISFVAREPSPESTHYAEILRRLDALAGDVAALRLSAPGEAR